MRYLSIAAVAMCAAVAACSAPDPPPTPAPSSTATPGRQVLVGAAGDSGAGLLVAHAYAAALNGSGVPARVKPQRDARAAVAALAAGRVDLVGLPADAAATALAPAAVVPTPSAAPSPSALPLDEALADLRAAAGAVDLAVLDPAEAVIGDVFVVRSGYAELNGVATLSELAERSQQNPVVLAAPPGCRRDPECAAVLVDTYGVEVSGRVTAPAARVPGLVAAKEAVVGRADATDHSLDSLRLQVLTDDRSVLPPDNVVPLVGADAATAPVQDAVGRVQASLSPEALRRLDAAVAGGAEPAAAADAWVSTTLGR